MTSSRGRRTWRWAAALVLATGVLASSGLASATAAPSRSAAAVAAASAEVVAPQANSIPGRYIVTLRPGADADAAATRERGLGKWVDQVFRSAVRGFVANLSPDDVAALAQDPTVERIEPDSIVTVNATTQSQATWGLDRIDQRALPLDRAYAYENDGSGVKAYVIDTGIRTTHTDFGGRAVAGYDAVGGVSPPASDCNGHGTHVAGTIGGSTYGVAKQVTLVAVRVLGCNGSGATSGVIAGIDWVTSDHLAGQPAVANMSLGGSYSQSLNAAVARAVADGVVFAVAAGNSNANACSYSPSSEPSAITVGATGSDDARASFSNFGTCVDVFAPGVNITSDWNSSDSGTAVLSGTSMATPHTVGVAALYLAANPSATPSDVAQGLVGRATQSVVGNGGTGSPNLLLYSLSDSAAAPPPPPPPPTPPANDNFASAITIGPGAGTTTGTTANATKESGEPSHAGNTGGRSVWYRFTPNATGTATIDTGGSAFDTLLAVYTGTAVNALTQVASNNDTSGLGTQSRVQFAVTAGTTYNVAVDGNAGASGALTLNWTVAVPPPPQGPSLSINDASTTEGAKFTKKNLVFTVTLSAKASNSVSVSYATKNGTATGAIDYMVKSGTVTIPAGSTSTTITISISGDSSKEPDETFTVNLSKPTGGAVIGDGVGVGTIRNDD